MRSFGGEFATSLEKDRLIGLTDIGDFFARLYQHRLVNALLSATDDAKDRRNQYMMEKMLYRFANGTSYRDPSVGPPRILSIVRGYSYRRR